jgi:hypothetical protein
MVRDRAASGDVRAVKPALPVIDVGKQKNALEIEKRPCKNVESL